MRRKKSQPPVDWADGRSPYAGITFLSDHDLCARHYHLGIVGWSAESPYRKLGDGVLPNHLVYRISGIETVVTELTLDLDARRSIGGEEADVAFWPAAATLVQQALGGEAAVRSNCAIPTDENISLDVDGGRVLLGLDAWQVPKDSGYGRKLTIRHSAYRDPFVHLT